MKSEEDVMKFNIKYSLPEWISFFCSNLHVFDHLPLPNMTQTSSSKTKAHAHSQHVDFFYTLDAALTWETTFFSGKRKKKVCMASPLRAATLAVVMQWKVSTQESSPLPGNETITDLAMIWFVFLGYHDWKNHKATVKIDGKCTQYTRKSKYSTHNSM